MSERFSPGSETWFASDSPGTRFSAVFEDDCETAYFYAYDREALANPILDGVRIYDAASVSDRSTWTAEVIWSPDGLTTALLLNGHPHAIIDFAAHVTYCRADVSSGSNRWRHAPWDDAVMERFQGPR